MTGQPAVPTGTREGSRTMSFVRRTKAQTRVTALTEGDCLIMPYHELFRVHKLLRSSPSCHAAMQQVANMESMLLQLPLFYGLASSSARLQLRDLISYRAAEAGQRIQSGEESGEAFYIIMRGSVTVHDAVDHRQSEKLGVTPGKLNGSKLTATDARRFKPVKFSYGEGQYFGGASLFKDARPRPGKELEVFASSRTVLACINSANFARLLSVDQNLQRTLLQEAKRRLLYSYRAARIPFFCEMADPTLHKYAELASLVPMPPTTPIDTATEDMRGLYVIADGVVEATVRGSNSSDADVMTLSYGHYFGELNFMLPSAPLVTSYAVAEEEVTLLVLPAAAFAHLFNKDRSLLAELRMKVHGIDSSLMTILEHRRSRALFLESLRKGGASQEGRLHFYEAVSQYLQLEPLGFRAAARAIAEGIVTEYVPDYSPTRVELSPPLRREMLQALRDGSIDKYPDLLSRAREDVYDELERVSLRPFTSSDPFLQLLDALSQGCDMTQLKHELSEFEA